MRAFCAVAVLVALVPATPVLRAAPVSFQDDFSRPDLGAWETDGFSWQILDGRLVADLGLPAWASLAESPLYAVVRFEATVIPRAAAARDWKLAGISLAQDERNFWHLALVEKPDSQDKGHFVELSEMRSGQWLAQQNLRRIGRGDMALDWQYGVPYRLRLALSAAGIEGWVLSAEGAELVHLGFAFTADAVRTGRPALRVSNLRAAFDDVAVTADTEGAVPRPVPGQKEFPEYAVPGSGIRASIPANGFFQVEKDGDRWWFVDPRGERFYAVGTDHVNYWAHWCQKLGYAPYHRNCEKLYGSPEKWAESAARRLREWGFNLLGAGNVEQVRYRGLAHTLFAAFGSTFSDISALVEKTTWTGFPNVFDPRWEPYCAARAKAACAGNRSDPWLLGYFLDNELEWYGKTHAQDGIWTETMKLPPDHTGKQALVQRLRKAHGTLDAFNTAWGRHAASWDEVLAWTALPPASDEARAVQRAFLEEVAERYFAVAAAAVRKADPNHLVIGSRFAGDAPEWAWRACARHCDVVTFNHYPRIDFESGDLSSLAGVFGRYYELTQRPLMITEWSFPALDSGLPCTAGAGMRVDTQEQKAKCFEVMQHLHFRLPFLVGSDYFMWVDEPAEGISDTFPEDSNYGLVDVEDRPWPELTAMAARLNPLAVRLHSGEIPEVYLTGLEHGPDGLLVTARNAGDRPAVAQVRVVSGQRVLGTQRLELPPGGEETVRVEGAPQLPPGLHQVTAELVAPEGWVPRGCRGVKRLNRCVYIGPAGGTPLCLVNTADAALPPFPVPLPTAGVAGGAGEFVTVEGAVLPLLPFAEGIAVLRVPGLAAGAALAGFLRPGAGSGPGTVTVERTNRGGFTLDNGVLRLEHDGTSGNIVDRISVNGVPLGRYNPLVWQQPDGDNQWVQTDALAAVDFQELPGGVVLTVGARRAAAGPIITAVDAQGRMAAARGRPVPFEVRHRLAVVPGVPFLVARCLSVTNLDAERPLVLKAPFFYLQSFLGGQPEGDRVGSGRQQVPNYYRISGAASWHDEEAGAWYGCAPLDERVHARFWLDEGGGQHPDAMLTLPEPVVLPPGQTWKPADSGALLVYGALDRSEGPAAWAAVRQTADNAAALQVVPATPAARPR